MKAEKYFRLIERAFGGEPNLKANYQSVVPFIAKYLGLNPVSVYRWSYSKTRPRGLGGNIPKKHFPALLELAAQLEIPTSRLTELVID